MKYLLLLLPIMGISQAEGLRDIPVVTYKFNSVRLPIDTFPKWELESGVDHASFQSTTCTEKDRAIMKMMVDIDCFGLSPSDLGFDCDSSRCEGGVHDGFIVKQDAIKTMFPECPYLVAVYPVQPRLPIGRLWRGNQGNDPMDWIFVCKGCFYKKGDLMILD